MDALDGDLDWRAWLMSWDDAVLREALRLELEKSDGLLGWGVVLIGGLTEDMRTSITAITPRERVRLTPELLHSMSQRVLMLGGYVRIHLEMPAALAGWPPHLGVPELAFRFVPPRPAELAAHAPQELRGTLDWSDLARTPLAILTTERLEGWPP